MPDRRTEAPRSRATQRAELRNCSTTFAYAHTPRANARHSRAVALERCAPTRRAAVVSSRQPHVGHMRELQIGYRLELGNAATLSRAAVIMIVGLSLARLSEYEARSAVTYSRWRRCCQSVQRAKRSETREASGSRSNDISPDDPRRSFRTVSARTARRRTIPNKGARSWRKPERISFREMCDGVACRQA